MRAREKPFFVQGQVLAPGLGRGLFGSDLGVCSALVGLTGMPQPFPSHCTLHVILHSFVTLISRGPGVNSLNGSGLVLDSSQVNPRLDRAPISPQSLLLFNTFRKRANRNSGDRKPEFNSFKPCKADDKPTRISGWTHVFLSAPRRRPAWEGGGWMQCCLATLFRPA